jgi:hypothetical protein
MIRKRGSQSCYDDNDDEENAAFLNDASVSKQPKQKTSDEGSRKSCIFLMAVLSVTLLVYLLVTGAIKGNTIVLVLILGVPSA